MKKLRLAAAAALAGAVTLLSSGAAQAYPDPSITITIPSSVIYGGDTFSYTADSNGVDCVWTVTYADGRAAGESATQTGTGTSISGSYKTKKVSKKFKSPIRATCRYDDAAVVSASGAVRSASASATVTLLPRGTNNDDDSTDDNGALPDTGGSNLWILGLGAALLVGGAGVTYAARRRQHA